MGTYRKAAWLAGGTAVAAYGLIALGGAVHNTGSSLACPDWPLCQGEWLPAMTGGVLFEHGHRLLGAAVGLGIIVLNLLLGRVSPARAESTTHGRWGLPTLMILLSLLGGAMILPAFASPAATATLAVCLTGLAALGFALLAWPSGAGAPGLSHKALALLDLVLLQGLLGGTTVKYHLPHLISTAHLTLSMIVLLTLVYLAWACAHRAAHMPQNTTPQAKVPVQADATLQTSTLAAPTWRAARGAEQLYRVTLAAVFCQMILGALIRHTGASTVAGWGLRYAILGQDPTTGAYALWPAYLPAAVNVLHRYLAVVVALMVILCCARGQTLLGAAVGNARAWLPAGLTLLQIAVGIAMLAAWELQIYPALHMSDAAANTIQVILRTTHLAVATALLVSLFALVLQAGESRRQADPAGDREPDRSNNPQPAAGAVVAD